MGTKVIKLDNNKHGSYHFETIDPKGNSHHFSGTIHNITNNESIIRTFEMEHTPYPPQMEFLQFESLGEENSKLTMRIIFKSLADRDNMLKLPLAQGINWAHNRLQEIVKQQNQLS